MGRGHLGDVLRELVEHYHTPGRTRVWASGRRLPPAWCQALQRERSSAGIVWAVSSTNTGGLPDAAT